ncbi:hypothetical protein DFJ58DRAFT_738618 [Suillus subalutaceus]|uniref:uncharacterized protein n=1 Tax=Suillus subalutaceus TaxID=48586 RepID=UPI001B870FE6|nr:uncharacterized protein DFJ58DRAFT_738618 [Suillus subalutaceus]KAG1825135.1 hypothetical protein DFJ58DRAFT_738618 [Suillus subalutaceus]
MVRPVIHHTAKAKLQAARERHRRHYAKDEILKRRRELCSSKTKESKAANKFTKELSKAVAKALYREDEDESESEFESDSDDLESDNDDKPCDLPECLCILKDIKDKILEMISDDPCKFIKGVLCKYVKSFPEDSSPGDISIIKTSIIKVQNILNRTIAVHDQILNFCGVSPEWHAADSVTCFLRWRLHI